MGTFQSGISLFHINQSLIMRQVTTTLYKFDELSKKAKKVAIEATRNNQGYLDYDWWQYDFFIKELEEQGFSDVDISIRGFYSQGDGASFTAKVDLLKFLTANKWLNDKRIVKLIEAGSINLIGEIKRTRWRHYVHERTTELIYGIHGVNNHSNIENAILTALVGFEDWLISKNIEIYNELQEQYEYLMSDEAIKNHLIANKCEFYENGDPF